MKKKPQSIYEAFMIAERVTSRKQAKKLLKRFKKLQRKHNDLQQERLQTSVPQGQEDETRTRD
tara:strand:+ start:253 stop:441 length:189 start_codon:yes stop_codon:yes gene_type:complete